MHRQWMWIICGLIVASGAAAQEMRTWTSASGATIEAAFVEQQFDLVILQRADGEKMKIRLNRLSPADQMVIGRLKTTLPSRTRQGASDTDAEIPPALEELLGRRLVNAKGRKVSTATLAGKKIGLYFSASWCPPCRTFTPLLATAYQQLQTEGKPFEVILVPHDRDEASMRAYMRSHDMPWLAIPFGSRAIEALQKKYSVSGIPKLVIIDAAAQTLSSDARGAVTTQGAAAFDGW
ncbi:MAG: thioredoxin-like domain-containing protein [Kiritimatiellae bacterium]|nr:thioredoxin-like domain-containing protein [Kiritimatiellia bacterium]MDD4342160.1 thioredoxin-like domain-containing protein [Kiritimatiellia bacterium]